MLNCSYCGFTSWSNGFTAKALIHPFYFLLVLGPFCAQLIKLCYFSYRARIFLCFLSGKYFFRKCTFWYKPTIDCWMRLTLKCMIFNTFQVLYLIKTIANLYQTKYGQFYRTAFGKNKLKHLWGQIPVTMGPYVLY